MRSATLFSGGEGAGLGMVAAGWEHLHFSPDYDIIPLVKQVETGRFLFISAGGFNSISYWPERPLLSDFRPAACLTPSADNKGRFVMTELNETIYAVDKIRVRLGSANKAHYHSRGYGVYGKDYAVVSIEDMPENSGVRVPVICPRCKRKRNLTRQQVSVAGHTYCKACVKHINRFQDISGRRFRRLIAIKPVGKDNNNATEWLCKCDCGNRTVTTITRLNNGLTNSCGCLRIERTIEAVSGKKNINFNPALTDRERVERRVIPKYRKWQRLVKERDNFTCQACGQYGGKLTSHHLNGWDTFIEQRFDLDNGVTLCASCHIDFHNSYGRGGNTAKQYYEWLRAG